jgi:ribose transport system ATP-binding protein
MVKRGENVLTLAGVSKSFPGVKALDSVDLSVCAGEVHGLVGENGAGKSTLMAVAAGALRANEGIVTLMERQIDGDPELVRDLGLSIVRQEPLLMPDLTVAENIYLGLPSRLRPRVGDMHRFAKDALLRWSADTGVHATDRIEALNPEKRFIVEIVKALAGEVRVLVLDEPTEHLVSEDVQRLFQRIRALAERDTAIIYISHRIKEVRAIADRLTVLRDGKSIGTYQARDLSEDDIVELIVGATLDAEFPPKGCDFERAPVVLRVANYSGPGYADVSMEVRRGEIVGLAGIDANGQREFLRGLAGLNVGDGRVSVNGRQLKIKSVSAALRGGFSFLPGDRHREGMVADLSVRENFSMRSMVADLRGPFLNRRSEDERAARAVTDFAVKTPSIETSVGNLSGGNQQKLVLASVLASEPKVMLVDEPTQGVDVGARAEIYRTLRRVADTGVAILAVSSDSTEIAGLCDRVMIFSRGSIVERLEGASVTESNITSAVLKSTSVRQRVVGRNQSLLTWAAGDWAPTVMVAVAVLIMGVVATWINPTYLSPLGLGGMMLQVATLAFVAYGQQLLMLVGGIDLSVGPLMGLVGVVGSFFLGEDVGSLVHTLGWLMVAATAIATGLLNYGLIEIVRLHPLIATLATYMGLQAVSLVLRPTADGMFDFAVLDMLGSGVWFVPIAFLIAVLMGVALEQLLFAHRLGVAIRGHGSRPVAATLMGVSPIRMRLIAYVGCSMFAGVGGVVLMGQVGEGDPRAGLGYTLTSIAAAVIGGASLFGGRGSFVGALFGSILIIQVNQVTSFVHLDTAWSSGLLGTMILAAVTFYSTSRKRALRA